MRRVVAGITVSVDGYITGPKDGPGGGLGVGGERLHYWVFGGPWNYDSPVRGQPTGVDKAWLEEVLAAGLVDELTIVTAPVLLGAGKPLFDGFSTSVELEHLGVRQSPFATFIHYAVKR